MKTSTKVLILVFVVLVAIYLGQEYFGGKTRSESYKSKLVEINTEEVNMMRLTKGEQEITLKRSGEEWRLTLPSGKEVPAKYSAVEQAVNSLESITPDKMVARVSEKWAEYEVDTAGTRVEIYEGDKKTLDIVLGKFGMRGQNQFYNHVRLFDNDEVYVANDFISFTVPYGPDSYRDQDLFDIQKDSLTSITFEYPADSSFVMEKQDDHWLVEGVEADSSALAGYFGSLAYKASSSFEDETEQSSLGQPLWKITFKATNKETVVDAYQEGDKWFVKTSENVSLFSDDELLREIFVGKTVLLGGK